MLSVQNFEMGPGKIPTDTQGTEGRRENPEK
jgi:hypothetical protein